MVKLFPTSFKRLLSPSLVIVYQYGKVGSTSLANSLECGLNIHDMYGTPMCPPGFKLRNSLLYRYINFPLRRLIRRLILKKRKNLKILVPIRQPCERNASMFFQTLPFWYVSYFKKYNRKVDAKAEGVDDLQKIFNKEFPHDACDEWFAPSVRMTVVPSDTLFL